ncbi:MAG: START-like domain-containing protein [Bacteroidota bacterium]
MERVKYTVEFMCRASPAIVYKFLTTPSCLMRWFCDEVDIEGDTYTYIWAGQPEVAELIESEENQRLRFQWEDSEPEEYLEFRIGKGEVTNGTIIYITDFADEDEVEDSKNLWETQITRMKEEMGG